MTARKMPTVLPKLIGLWPQNIPVRSSRCIARREHMAVLLLLDWGSGA